MDVFLNIYVYGIETFCNDSIVVCVAAIHERSRNAGPQQRFQRFTCSEPEKFFPNETSFVMKDFFFFFGVRTFYPKAENKNWKTHEGIPLSPFNSSMPRLNSSPRRKTSTKYLHAQTLQEFASTMAGSP